MITSSHNTKLKQIRALAGRSRERHEAGAFLGEGVRLVEDALDSGWPFLYALFSDETSKRGHALVNRLIEAGVDVEEVKPDILRSASETENTQGILAVLKLSPLSLPPVPTFVLIPDQIRDPGNLGTLIRTAAAVGVQAVLIPPETVDPYSPKVVRSGMGAHFKLPVCALDWPEIKNYLSGAVVYLADAGGDLNCWKADFRQPVALVVGGEADGASEHARNLANFVVNIPMPGKIESINAGVAGSVLMFEVIRQRNEAQ